jgi:hypothetical protein
MRASIPLVLAGLLGAMSLRADAPRLLSASDQWLLAHLRAPFALACTASAPGLVVAEVELTAGSRSVGAAILEAPSLALAECVQRALLALSFRAPEGATGDQFRSKLMLYAVARARGSMELIPAPRMSSAPAANLSSPAERRP